MPNGIWEKPAALNAGELERVRLHPYYTERVLEHANALAALAPIAGAHHERLDGSGYHRGSKAAGIGVGARLLAVADAYDAMTHDRPYRPALSPRAGARGARRHGERPSMREGARSMPCWRRQALRRSMSVRATRPA